mmetsp:Transcript_31474/g.94163  ORF Transcript_31474/g.94163 Transcript_31474/m.94163 type:complete len:238 (+) Transcript_31474:530-1243(+)
MDSSSVFRGIGCGAAAAAAEDKGMLLGYTDEHESGQALESFALVSGFCSPCCSTSVFVIVTEESSAPTLCLTLLDSFSILISCGGGISFTSGVTRARVSSFLGFLWCLPLSIARIYLRLPRKGGFEDSVARTEEHDAVPLACLASFCIVSPALHTRVVTAAQRTSGFTSLPAPSVASWSDRHFSTSTRMDSTASAGRDKVCTARFRLMRATESCTAEAEDDDGVESGVRVVRETDRT